MMSCFLPLGEIDAQGAVTGLEVLNLLVNDLRFWEE